MSLSKIKKLIVTMIASVTGISGVSVSSSILAYDALFMRTKRPDYTITAGLTFYRKGMSLDELLKEVDTLLYAGKEAGRNRVTHSKL